MTIFISVFKNRQRTTSTRRMRTDMSLQPYPAFPTSRSGSTETAPTLDWAI